MFELTEHLNRKECKTATREELDQAIGKMLAAARNYWLNYWESELTAPEREMVLAVWSKQALPPGKGDVLKSLLRKEVFYKTDAGYTFCVPVLGEWLKAYL